MRKLLSLVALACAMIVGGGAFVPRANATVLPSGVVTLKGEKSDVILQARYRCWSTDEGYRRCAYGHRRHWGGRYWRHHGYWRHRHWGQRYYWRRHHYYGGYGGSDSDYTPGYYHRRHYYYRSYDRPSYGYRGLYRNCIGICWW